MGSHRRRDSLMPWLVLGKSEVVVVEATMCVALGYRWAVTVAVSNGVGNPSEQSRWGFSGCWNRGGLSVVDSLRWWLSKPPCVSPLAIVGLSSSPFPVGLATLASKGKTLVEGLVEQGWVEPKCRLELLNRESGLGARSPCSDV
ncbi:hypothetical protein V6N11_013871 [Hibiscus sabdariffa]|uniref:Uncharacterized protein n=1 Tax=Hibiscus sabdariffa TaxID=183260 RepID=A0ABR2NKG0_9ROSI